MAKNQNPEKEALFARLRKEWEHKQYAKLVGDIVAPMEKNVAKDNRELKTWVSLFLLGGFGQRTNESE